MHLLKLTTKFLTLTFAILIFAIVGAKADKLDDIMDKYNCVTFIRPSGTENVLRIYIESNDNLYNIRKEIDYYL